MLSMPSQGRGSRHIKKSQSANRFIDPTSQDINQILQLDKQFSSSNVSRRKSKEQVSITQQVLENIQELDKCISNL